MEKEPMGLSAFVLAGVALGGGVSGRVVDLEGRPAKLEWALGLSLGRIDGDGGGRVELAEDGSFRLEGLAPGRYGFSVFDPMHVPRGYEVVRVEVNGAASPDGTFEIG